MISPELAEQLHNEHYEELRELPTGEVAGLLRMLFTVGLMVGLDEHTYRTRFCYPNRQEALRALRAWDGRGDPPGPWIKEKPADRPNPNLKGIPIVTASGSPDEPAGMS